MIYSKEFRGEVLAACDAGRGTQIVAARLHVSESWVRWIKQECQELRQVASKTSQTAPCKLLNLLAKRNDRRTDVPAREISPNAANGRHSTTHVSPLLNRASRLPLPSCSRALSTWLRTASSYTGRSTLRKTPSGSGNSGCRI